MVGRKQGPNHDSVNGSCLARRSQDALFNWTGRPIRFAEDQKARCAKHDTCAVVHMRGRRGVQKKKEGIKSLAGRDWYLSWRST